MAESKILSRIEKTLEQVCAQQEEVCKRIEGLEKRIGALSPANGGARPEEVIAFLDQFRAGEALGEASLGAWIAVSDTACLRGGLRTIQMREGMHAKLLEERLKELGASPTFELPDAVVDAAMKGAADAAKSDAEKVKEFVARFSDVDAALKPIHDLADRLDGDQETQSLLRTIAQDERSTLEFLNEACALLNA